MSIRVKVPTPLRKFTGGESAVTAEGATIAALLDNLEKNHPGLKDRLCEADGTVRRFVNLYVNGDDIRFLDNTNTKIADGAEVSIVPAIAGGTAASR